MQGIVKNVCIRNTKPVAANLSKKKNFNKKVLQMVLNRQVDVWLVVVSEILVVSAGVKGIFMLSGPSVRK